MTKRYYLASGSNLNVRQMLKRCPTARLIGTTIIPEYRLLFKGSKTGSYLTIEKKKSSFVPAAIWEVQKTDEQKLDVYEGFPSFYYKKDFRLPVIGIRTGKIRTLKVFAYIMHEDRELGTPSKHYMSVCYDFNFDPKYLIKAFNESAKER